MHALSASNLTYDVAQEGDFRLKPNRDFELGCFAIWEKGLSQEERIAEDLARTFQIVGDYRVKWSDDAYRGNIARLYQWVHAGSGGAFTRYDEKIGRTPFRFIVVRDPSPSYTWKRSVSRAIEPTNERMVEKKYLYRSWIKERFQVHSSNNLTEFLYQTCLILGPSRLEALVSGEGTDPGNPILLEKDLEGAGGWADWAELFRVLDCCCDYLVLRNFESLPDRLDDGDIDFLTDSCQTLASAAGLSQLAHRPYKGRVTVGGQTVPVDIRFPGDGYYPAVWQKDMLARKVTARGVHVPAPDDHFFSLLYHAAVHKPHVKPDYARRLAAMAEAMRFDWFDPAKLGDREELGRLLSGYMRARQYYYQDPVDPGVGRSADVIWTLPAPTGVRRRTLPALVKEAFRNPAKVPRYVARRLKLR
jgi:hypothetical protein